MSNVFMAGGGIGQTSVPLQIRTSGKDVIASGTVITFDNKNVEFQVAHLKIVLEFLNDGTGTKMEGSSSASSSLTLKLYNFNNSIGSGTTSPIDIGTFNGRKLWLAFMVYALSDSGSKTVHYTFMLGDQA